MENHKSHIFRQKRKIDFEVWIERKRPALSLLKPRKINSPRRSTVGEPVQPSQAPRGMGRVRHGPTSSLPAIPVSLWWRPSAKQTMRGEGTENGENEEEVEMMLSAEASLEVKDERLARSSFVMDKRGLEEGRHRLLSENVR